MRRPRLNFNGSVKAIKTDYVCPHCGVLQAVEALYQRFEAVTVVVTQCVNCLDISVDAVFFEDADHNVYESGRANFFPQSSIRPSKLFNYAPPEVVSAYVEACYLFPIHTGASGAYARRALELVLDHAGYVSKSLAESILLAEGDRDPDKRLSRGLLLQLNYIKEIGNFALHVRRDDELIIIPINEVEVTACLETLEELIEHLFEAPGAEYQRIEALNEKLKAAGKKQISLPAQAHIASISGPTKGDLVEKS